MVLALLDCHSAKTVRAGMQGQTDAAEVMGIVASKNETTHLRYCADGRHQLRQGVNFENVSF